MPRLDRLPQLTRNLLLTRAVEINDEAPWTPLARPLAEVTVALVTSAGVHTRDDEPFVRNDPSYRRIPSTVQAADLLQSHASTVFDRSGFMQDVNVVFPIDRLREADKSGTIGSLAPTFFSFMGAQQDVSEIISRTGLEVAESLVAENVDVALLTPSCPICTSTTSVLARTFEAHGISTVTISLVREHTVKIKPPRALYVPFPFGLSVGHPNNVEEQGSVLKAALDLLERETGPVLEDYADGEAISERGAPLQSSMVAPAEVPTDPATEASLMRKYWERWKDKTGRTAVGLSRIDPSQFRGIIRFLQSYSRGEIDQVPPDRTEPLGVYIRRCVEDLRTMYIEARMFTNPTEPAENRDAWFWGQTALSTLLRSVADRMRASSDPETAGAARGVAQ